MGTNKPLVVLLSGAVAGTLEIDDSSRAKFTYDDRYLSNEAAVPLSVSLPLGDKTFDHDETLRWVEGLLPDNDKVLQRWALNEGVSPATPLELIATRIGHDCAGAVQFCSEDDLEMLQSRTGTVRRLADSEIDKEIALMAGDTTRWLPDDEDVYFSLGGYQAKTALYRLDDGWGRPSGDMPTTHILKPSPAALPAQAITEHLCMSTAASLGLDVAGSEIAVHAGHPTAIIARFDRTRVDGQWRRIHQEDMCQALGCMPHRKYEKMGGPGASQIGDVISIHSNDPQADRRKFRDALLYYWMVVNRDGHARNFSLVIRPDSIRFAPLYDINSVLPFAKRRIGGLELAMRLGKDFTVDQAGAEDSLLNLSVLLELPAGETVSRAEEMAATLTESATSNVNTLPTSLQDSESIDAFLKRLHKRAVDCQKSITANRHHIERRNASSQAWQRRRQCGHIGTRSQKPCVLPLGHKSSHRYKQPG